jgi:peptide deformylase
MILPIRAIGDPILRKKCLDIGSDYPGLSDLIANMFQTMKAARGVGLAAPQVGKDIRLFIVDSPRMYEDPALGIRKVFINARIESEFDERWSYEEGCLSIPDVREDVERNKKIRIRFLDEKFMEHSEEYDDLNARVIQHEYDHIEGILFVDHLSAFKRQLLKGRFNNISKGKVSVEYKMKFPKT